MKLILSLTGSEPAAERSHEFTEEGGTIGRAAGNDWVLADPERHLSKTHCQVEYADGRFLLVDTSANGVYINSDAQPLGRGNRTALADGDRIRLGKYVMEVEVEGEAPAAKPKKQEQEVNPNDTFLSKLLGEKPKASTGREDGVFGIGSTVPPPRSTQQIPEDDDIDAFINPIRPKAEPAPRTSPGGGGDYIPEDDDFLSDISSEPKGQRPPPPPPSKLIPEDEDFLVTPQEKWDHAGPSDADHLPMHEQQFRAPVFRQEDSKSGIPDDWDDDPLSAPTRTPPSREVRPAPVARREEPRIPDEDAAFTQRPVARPRTQMPPTPPPPRAVTSAPIPTGGNPIETFLAAAGLSDLKLPPAEAERLMVTAGKLLAETVAGLHQLLVARGSIKRELRLDQTIAGAANNNAIKVAQDGHEALATLLIGRAPMFVDPIAAVKEAVDDVAGHHIAMMAGLQGAVNAMVKRFDPKSLEKKLEGHSGLSAILPGSRKARYWEIYEEMYRQIAEEAEDDFRTVVGRDFGAAYAESLKERE